jgi:hypothetical protein
MKRMLDQKTGMIFFSPTMLRKKYSIDREKLLKFAAEGREFAKI